MSGKEQIVCGLDVGTWKTCTAMVRVKRDGRLELVGTGYSNSHGMTKGVVVNLKEAAGSIRSATEEAELMSGIPIDWVVAGISGEHIQSYNWRGALSIGGKHLEVTAEDMAQVIHAAQSIPLPPEREIIHVLPQEFFLDNRGGISNPVGLTGSQLNVNIHVVTCDSTLSQNLINAINKALLRVRRIVLQSLASGEAVLTPEEKELGTAVVDIGGETTGLALFVKNSIYFTSVLPVGGTHFTRDLVKGIHAPNEEAERLKREFGNVLPERIADDEVITFRGLGNRGARDLSRKKACEVLSDRGVELLGLVKDEIIRSGSHKQLVGGAVLTGGGSMLQGILELAEEILELPVRQGLPQGLDGLTGELMHPVYAGAIGLAILEARGTSGRMKRHITSTSMPSLIDGFLSWLGD